MTSTTLPAQIPIFPLPNVVLFPNVFLPLHIFEPRYRDMVGDALSGDRIIGMVTGRTVFDGAPADLSTEKIRHIYGADGEGEDIDVTITSTDLGAITETATVE